MPEPFTAALCLVVLVTGGAAVNGACAQLRPLEPVAWPIFEPGTRWIVRAGAAGYTKQRASLAGTRGRLVEAGNVTVLWRTGRIALEAAGTAVRVFEDRGAFAEPTGDARAPDGGLRIDAGDWRLATLLRLTPSGWNPAAALRFGARLPTTDNRVGLDRDRTDFFARLSGRITWRRLRFTAESGVGIYGTRDPSYEQSDVWVFAATAGYVHSTLRTWVSLVGRQHGRDRGAPRGSENLRELRAGVRIGGRRWMRVEAVRGLAAFSPRLGIRVGVGFRLPCRGSPD